jgi:hypothetical protein
VSNLLPSVHADPGNPASLIISARYSDRSDGDAWPKAGETVAVKLPAQSLPDIEEDDLPQPRKREFSSSLAFIGVVVMGALVVVLCALGTTMSGLFNFSSNSDGSNADAGPNTSASAPRDAADSFGDGQWLVSVDIKPGTYSVTVPANADNCTWERNASTDGTSSSVLESGIGKPGEALVVGINTTDKVFQSSGCGSWHRTGEVEPSKDQSYTDNNGGGTDD